jgi:hypothetical protein
MRISFVVVVVVVVVGARSMEALIRGIHGSGHALPTKLAMVRKVLCSYRIADWPTFQALLTLVGDYLQVCRTILTTQWHTNQQHSLRLVLRPSPLAHCVLGH